VTKACHLMKIIAFTLTTILLFGCATTSPPTYFYILASLDPASGPTGRQVGADVLIGVGPISFPERLNRPNIAIRESRNKLYLSEFHRWAGTLENEFATAIARDMEILLNTNRVIHFPWNVAMLAARNPAQITYQVTMDVDRFDATMGDNATLRVSWVILEGLEGDVLVVKTSTYTEPVEGEDLDAVVAAMNRNLDNFCRDIAEAIISVDKKRESVKDLSNANLEAKHI
jgi:uncharacterized lipoprotein YmbA